ncbi:MAG: RNA polymerase sigma factor [Planctomycetes bacterium]|nr:RNA polymerase sigma factor [Planctomycetota bacterium]
MNAVMVVSQETSDCDLIAAAQRGDRNALDAFVRRHEGWVRHVVYATLGRPMMVDDVAQHVWSTLCQQLGTLVEIDRWRPWLFRMARNAAIDAGLKGARERKRRSGMVEDDPPSSRPDDPVRSLIGNEEYRRVLDAIHGLPEIYREPFVLRHLEDWSYAQIAEAMGLPVDTVETRLVRARRLLRSALSDAQNTV